MIQELLRALVAQKGQGGRLLGPGLMKCRCETVPEQSPAKRKKQTVRTERYPCGGYRGLCRRTGGLEGLFFKPPGSEARISSRISSMCWTSSPQWKRKSAQLIQFGTSCASYPIGPGTTASRDRYDLPFVAMPHISCPQALPILY